MFTINQIYRIINGCKSNLQKNIKNTKSKYNAVNVRDMHELKPNLETDTKSFKLRKALLISKLTRYEFERYRYPELSDTELETKIRDRGTDYDTLTYYYNLHKKFEQKVAKSFQDLGVEIDIVNRTTITKEKVKWADILVPVGGDGTFLLAATRASLFFSDGLYHTPVVGFNSDPNRSEGRLMIPHQYSVDVKGAIKRILSGDFKWMERSRIRITMIGSNNKFSPPVDLHETSTVPLPNAHPEAELLNEFEKNNYQATYKRILPYLALNEVFIGETLSARVSNLQLKVDDTNYLTKTKCSGLCVSTGTGSTSWLTSINRLSAHDVEEIFDILRGGCTGLEKMDPKVISEKYNRKLIFPSNDPRLCYSIRDEIYVGVWPNPKGLNGRGFAKSLFVKSRCIDAGLVIDGSISYPFNDGTKALLEVRPEDALLTISME